nr:response regulator transcription factor [uncultured Eisenbergiella sp.]
MTRILIIEDDTDINNMTAEFLRGKGCEAEQAFSGTEGRLLWQMKEFDLLLLDLMLPGLSGEELIRQIRAASRIPVIVLTAKNALEDKVELLGGGADDYLTKPFELEELWVRIQVQLRHRGSTRGEKELVFKDWTIDREGRSLKAGGTLVELTAHELGIVELMMRHPKKVFTRQEIYEAVWQQDAFIEDKTINVHVSNIRAKLRAAGAQDYIQTVWGIGFKMAE